MQKVSRRNILKGGVGLLAGLGLGGISYASSRIVGLPGTDFSECFSRIDDFYKDEIKGIPMGVFGDAYKYCYSTSKGLVIGKHRDKDEILLPYYSIDKNEYTENIINQDCMKTLLAAAVDRNMVCYQEKREESSLFPIMNQIFRRNGGTFRRKITDVFYSDEHTFFAPIAKHHKIPNKYWKIVRDFYFNELNGIPAKNTRDFVLGIDTRNFDLVHARRHSSSLQIGIGVLDNRSVILGSF